MQPDPTPPSPGAAPTPGPWTARRHPRDPQQWSIDADGGDPTLGHSRWNGLAVYGCDDMPEEGAAVAEANARLIASAPTLAAQVSALTDALRGTERALAAILDNPAFELGTPTMDDVARGSEADRADAITSWDFAVKDGNVALSTARSTLAAIDSARAGTMGGERG